MAKVDFVSLNVYFKIKDPKDAKDDLYASVSVSDVKNIGELTGHKLQTTFFALFKTSLNLLVCQWKI